MPDRKRLSAAATRQTMYAALRRNLTAAGFTEVETPILVPAPGMEPHITAFEAAFHPETDVGSEHTLYLHTSPEYAMKRLLADGMGPIFQICKVFRNGEVSPAHNPEFTMLELYRPDADYARIMEDVEDALAEVEGACGRSGLFSIRPYERLTVRDAVQRHCGVDLRLCPDAAALARAAEEAGARLPAGAEELAYDDVFFHLFLQKVEPELGRDRPAFLTEFPASMAALARLKPGDPTVAERFELYVRGAELANGYSELTDAAEQRRRLGEERVLRRRLGRAAYPLDERFLEAVGRMPPSGGVAVGLDRVLMLLVGASSIDEVLLFPAREFV
ncbi:MAG TPA: EF-P lysine aminoacylase EpmA [Myxococcales bacterium]|nr:EF-P lysine aminoacylase EpmA [Myxococcales bacterium]